MWYMRGSRIFLVYIYIYIKGGFGNFILKWVGSGPDMTKT